MTLKRTIGLSLLLGFVLATPLNSMKPLQRASAWTGALPACSVDFNSFNWKSVIKDSVSNTAHYDVDQVSTVLIYRFTGQANGRFQVDLVPSPYLAAFTQGPPVFPQSTTSKSVQHANTTGFSNGGTSWEVDPTNKTVANNGTTAVNPAKNKYGNEGSGNAAELTCISTAKGYTQPYNWDSVAISSTVPSQGTESCNGALDFGCWIGKAFNGIGDGFNAVAQAIIKALAWLWAPDGVKTKAEFDNLNTFMQAKLGFLTYPFTFMNSIFTKFGDTTNNWCNNTACSKSFGNFYGQNVTIKFDQGKTTVPGIWNYMLLFIRGVFVLAIFFAILKKYREVTQR